jgi:hypothetical protein
MELENESDQLEALKAICSYSLTEKNPTFTSKTAKAIFTITKPTIDANIKQYKNGIKPKKKASEPKASQNEAKTKPPASQTEAKQKPTGSQTLTNKEKDKDKEKDKKNILTWFDDPDVNDAFMAYVEYRKKNRIPTTERALQEAKKELLKLSDKKEEQIAIINQSLVRGWRGLFPLKQDEKQKKNGFNNFEGQRDYDYDELEKLLLAN